MFIMSTNYAVAANQKHCHNIFILQPTCLCKCTRSLRAYTLCILFWLVGGIKVGQKNYIFVYMRVLGVSKSCNKTLISVYFWNSSYRNTMKSHFKTISSKPQCYNHLPRSLKCSESFGPGLFCHIIMDSHFIKHHQKEEARRLDIIQDEVLRRDVLTKLFQNSFFLSFIYLSKILVIKTDHYLSITSLLSELSSCKQYMQIILTSKAMLRFKIKMKLHMDTKTEKGGIIWENEEHLI